MGQGLLKRQDSMAPPIEVQGCPLDLLDFLLSGGEGIKL